MKQFSLFFFSLLTAISLFGCRKEAPEEISEAVESPIVVRNGNLTPVSNIRKEFFVLNMHIYNYYCLYLHVDSNVWSMEKRKYNRIKVVLVQKDKTGIWLSKKIGKSNTTVSKYLNQRVQPDLITLNAIADALEVDVKDLLVSNIE